MQQPSVLDIIKYLPKTNCRDCGFPACMAFAAMILQGQAELSQCPYISPEAADLFGGTAEQRTETVEERRDELMGQLKREISNVDFEEVAPQLAGEVCGEHLVLRCLGKRFELDQQGNLHSECHVNSWVHLPILSYTVRGQGRDLTGEWVAFSELKNATDWVRFFSHRCEKGMQSIAEKDPDLFFDALDILASERAEAKAGEAFATADYAVVVRPRPKVAMLVAYWNAEDEFDAKLSLLFDRSAEVNLGAESIYLLVMGMLEMLTRIMSKHGFRQ
jgi:hypothetical protein